jgi:hypothetical protein
MSDDLIQLIFAAALVLFGLLGSRKKRPTRRRPEPPRPRPKQPAPRSATPQPARPAPAPYPPAPRPQREVLVKELERLLGVPVEVEESGEIPEAVSLEQTDVEEKRTRTEGVGNRWTEGIERGNESLETLEEAGATSHELFHARYPTAAPAIVTGDAAPSGATLRLRQAIIWNEILGPPVSMR